MRDVFPILLHLNGLLSFVGLFLYGASLGRPHVAELVVYGGLGVVAWLFWAGVASWASATWRNEDMLRELLTHIKQPEKGTPGENAFLEKIKAKKAASQPNNQ